MGDVLRRIIYKATLNLVRGDVQDAVGSLQLCVGNDSGCDVAVHALRIIFEDEESEAVLLVDASVKQVWFADDSAACGKLCGLLQWWQQLVAKGPKDRSCSDHRLAYTRSHARSMPVARL